MRFAVPAIPDGGNTLFHGATLIPALPQPVYGSHQSEDAAIGTVVLGGAGALTYQGAKGQL